MWLVNTLNGVTPKLVHDCFIAENATIICQVSAGDSCSFWYVVTGLGRVCVLKTVFFGSSHSCMCTVHNH